MEEKDSGEDSEAKEEASVEDLEVKASGEDSEAKEEVSEEDSVVKASGEDSEEKEEVSEEVSEEDSEVNEEVFLVAKKYVECIDVDTVLLFYQILFLFTNLNVLII